MRLLRTIWQFIVGLFRRAEAPTLELPSATEETSPTVTNLEFDTAGGVPATAGEIVEAKAPPPVVASAETVPLLTPVTPKPTFVDGWYTGARRWPIHAGRIGGTIVGKCTVVHTTDMAPGTMPALLRRWKAVSGEGAGAHFLIGKTIDGMQAEVPTGGLVQLAPITRNGNHAGGSIVRDGKRVASHGWFRTKSGVLLHPNSHAIGIEVDNAGKLTRVNGKWVHRESGHVFADAEVFVDDRGHGWERATAFQLSCLETLLDALDGALEHFPAGVVVVSNGTYAANGCPEAALPGTREVGHWTLDPLRKSDPGPQFTELLRQRAR